ncbi:hypothetical protein LAZ67_14001057 [Cordylochernes scorpioides]|uniref:Uncharacterized protein n=1 Tax=Cordylochernes scorpioides TaxID=51811 RepID=A0ABY6L5V6_9ARAC|nr:hypothetical protein LAZ67_14001057 [Cordylochernes scorpioides]
MPGHRKRRKFKQTDAFTRGMVIGLKRAVIVAVYACGVDVEKGPIRQQLWNAPPCDNVESWLLKLWEAVSEILELNHRVLPPHQLQELHIIGDSRFLRPPDLLVASRASQVYSNKYILTNAIASQASHLMGLLEPAIARWPPLARNLSLMSRARAANSLILGSILHNL